MNYFEDLLNNQNLSINEYGTIVSIHTCKTCGVEFTLCPPQSDKLWPDCLGCNCDSYDIDRDVDKFFEDTQWN